MEEMMQIVICKDCGQPEYYGHMIWLNAKTHCRNCYRKLYEKQSGLAYAWDDLDGPRPTIDDYILKERRRKTEC